MKYTTKIANLAHDIGSMGKISWKVVAKDWSKLKARIISTEESDYDDVLFQQFAEMKVTGTSRQLRDFAKSEFTFVDWKNNK